MSWRFSAGLRLPGAPAPILVQAIFESAQPARPQDDIGLGAVCNSCTPGPVISPGSPRPTFLRSACCNLVGNSHGNVVTCYGVDALARGAASQKAGGSGRIRLGPPISRLHHRPEFSTRPEPRQAKPRRWSRDSGEVPEWIPRYVGRSPMKPEWLFSPVRKGARPQARRADVRNGQSGAEALIRQCPCGGRQ